MLSKVIKNWTLVDKFRIFLPFRCRNWRLTFLPHLNCELPRTKVDEEPPFSRTHFISLLHTLQHFITLLHKLQNSTHIS
eukprot:c11697_g1_i1 orf=179-415(+)